MNRAICFLASIFISISASADVFISADYQVSARTMKSFVSAYVAARDRDEDQKRQPTMLYIFDESGGKTSLRYVLCPALKPDKAGLGCLVRIHGSKNSSDVTVGFEKTLEGKQVEAFLKVLIEAENSLSEVVHLGNPFSQAVDGTGYSCKRSNDKRLECTLTVSEKVTAR